MGLWPNKQPQTALLEVRHLEHLKAGGERVWRKKLIKAEAAVGMWSNKQPQAALLEARHLEHLQAGGERVWRRN